MKKRILKIIHNLIDSIVMASLKRNFKTEYISHSDKRMPQTKNLKWPKDNPNDNALSLGHFNCAGDYRFW